MEKKKEKKKKEIDLCYNSRVEVFWKLIVRSSFTIELTAYLILNIYWCRVKQKWIDSLKIPDLDVLAGDDI